jgi:hypothetical protein
LQAQGKHTTPHIIGKSGTQGPFSKRRKKARTGELGKRNGYGKMAKHKGVTTQLQIADFRFEEPLANLQSEICNL